MYFHEIPMNVRVGDWLDSLSLDSLHALYLRTAKAWRVTAQRRPQESAHAKRGSPATTSIWPHPAVAGFGH